MSIKKITTATSEYTIAFTDMISTLQKDNYADYPWSELWCAMHFRRFVEADFCDVFVVEDELGVPCGFAIAAVNLLWFSPMKQYDEVVVIVKDTLEPMQAARTLRKLIREMEQRAEELGCNVMCIGTSTGCKSDAYARVLSNRGFKPFGRTMRKTF